MFDDISEDIIEGLILAFKRSRDRKDKDISEEEIKSIVEKYIETTIEDPIMRFIWDLVISGMFDLEFVDGEICIIVGDRKNEYDTDVHDGRSASEWEEHLGKTGSGKTLDPSDYES